MTLLVAGVFTGPGQEGERFDKQSLALRTALHYDPSLETPLDRLVSLYEEAGRREELVTLYHTHTTQYPDDVGASVVYIRVLQHLKRGESTAVARLAVERHPDNALLAYLLSRELDQRHEKGVLELLGRAVDLETDAARRGHWLEELLEKAATEGDVEIAREHLVAESARLAGSGSALVALAKKALEVRFEGGDSRRFAEVALGAIGDAQAAGLSPEEGVEAVLVAASAEAFMGRHTEAASRLETLLGKVAPDYWRRPEIVMRRVNLVGADAAREAMLKAARSAYEANPENEAAALELAELLEAAALRRDALDVLLEAAGRIPYSGRLEKRAIAALDRVGDERRAAAFLAQRLEKNPGRQDLAYRHVKALYASGDTVGARAELDRLLEQMGEGDRLDQVLDIARYLRRMGMTPEAVKMFARVVAARPERLDIRRELAETHLANGERDEARLLLTGGVGEDAETENFIDLVQFMVGEGFLGEARGALVARLVDSPHNFDLHLLLIDTLSRRGERGEGERLIEEARALTESPERYVRWLNAAASFHEVFDDADAFFEIEDGRFSGDLAGWETSDLAKFLTFCEVAKQNRRDDAVVASLRERLGEEGLPDEMKVGLRRLLVGVLENDADNFGEVFSQLERLEKEDPQGAPTYRLKMARIHYTAERPDLAKPLLKSVSPAEVQDSRVLAGMPTIYLEYGLVERASAVLERLVELEPGTLSHWEQWIALQGVLGREDDLRRSLRKLLAGVGGQHLSAKTSEGLRENLSASYWRSISRLLTGGGERDMVDVLALLDDVERASGVAGVSLWTLWTRAYVLGKLGRDKAKVEALDFLKDEVAARGGGGGETGGRISFPDGLVLSLSGADDFLEGDSLTQLQNPDRGETGPVDGLSLDWVFETTGGAKVTQILVPGGGDVFVGDELGRVARIEGRSGKLVWQIHPSAESSGGEKFRIGTSKVDQQRSAAKRKLTWFRVPRRSRTGAGVPLSVPRRIVADGGQHLFIPVGNSVECRDASKGNLVWRARVGEPLPLPAPSSKGRQVSAPLGRVSLFVDGTRVIAYSPAAAVVAGFLAGNGKLLWEVDLFNADDPTPPPALSSGAAYSNGLLFVYGTRSLVLETGRGKVLWTFDAGGAGEFPPQLELAQADGGKDGDPFGAIGVITDPLSLNYHRLSQVNGRQLNRLFSGRGRLVPPAVLWTDYFGDHGTILAGFVGRKLLLMGGRNVVALSMELPLGGMRFDVSGTYAGGRGSKAVMLERGGHSLRVLNVARGTERRVDLAQIHGGGAPGHVDVAVGSGRIYAVGEKGVLCSNAHSGARLFFEPWPEELAGADGKTGTPLPVEKSTLKYFWQGVASESTGWGGLCVPMRSAVAGGRLFAVVPPGRLAAFSNRNDPPMVTE